MNISILAAEIAQRVPDLAQDCTPNNEIMIAAIINRHVGVECAPNPPPQPPPTEPPKQVKTLVCGICNRPYVRTPVNTSPMGCNCWFEEWLRTAVKHVP